MKKIIIVSIVVVVAVVFALYDINYQESPIEVLACDETEEGRIEVISEFESSWGLLQTDISIRPVQGSTGRAWNSPDHIQFIGQDRIMIAFDDGHIMPMAIVEYSCSGGEVNDFTVIADDIGQPDGFPFASQALWQEMVENYGQLEEVKTYALYGIIDGEFVEFENWRQVDGNPFIRN